MRGRRVLKEEGLKDERWEEKRGDVVNEVGETEGGERNDNSK